MAFEDGLCFLEAHSSIRKANRISKSALPGSVLVDEDLDSHFRVTYDSDEQTKDVLGVGPGTSPKKLRRES